VSGKSRPPLWSIHSDETIESGEGSFSLKYWRRQKTPDIVESLRPGTDESLKVKPDGRIINGNVRIKILDERGFDVNGLEREKA
jgi:hypothetical protein